MESRSNALSDGDKLGSSNENPMINTSTIVYIVLPFSQACKFPHYLLGIHINYAYVNIFSLGITYSLVHAV